MARSWYGYMGGDDPTDVSNYIKISVKPNCLCGNEICAVYVRSTAFHLHDPLSPNLLLYIESALATGQLQPEDPYYAKKFVYLRQSL